MVGYAKFHTTVIDYLGRFVCLHGSITRYSVSMGVNLAIAVGGAVGWFFLAQYLFSKPGMDFIAGFVG